VLRKVAFAIGSDPISFLQEDFALMTWQGRPKQSEPRRKLTPQEELKRKEDERAWAGRSFSIERRYRARPEDFEKSDSE
jgi:hypothetical protein